MATTAKEAGLSVRDFQSAAFAGQVSGLSIEQVYSGLTKSAQLLNDARRNANTLSKEFDASGLSIKNANPPNPGSREHPLAGLSADDYESLTPSKVAGRDRGNDALDRAEESLLKYVKTQQAAADVRRFIRPNMV